MLPSPFVPIPPEGSLAAAAPRYAAPRDRPADDTAAHPLWLLGDAAESLAAARRLHAGSAMAEASFIHVPCHRADADRRCDAWVAAHETEELWAQGRGGTLYLDRIEHLSLWEYDWLIERRREHQSRGDAPCLIVSTVRDLRCHAADWERLCALFGDAPRPRRL